jgi:O-methyltransferase
MTQTRKVNQHLKAIGQFLPKRILRLGRFIFLGFHPTYNQDGLATCNNCDFINDKKFLESYNLGKSTGSWGSVEPLWRAYVVCWAANKAKSLPGDFIECGVNKGGYAIMAMNQVDFNKLRKKFYLLDTFEGLVEKYVTDDKRKRGILENFDYEKCYDAVKETFKDYPSVEIIKGAIPDTLPLVKADKVCYLSIDMNCTMPEIAAADFFWDKMVSGAVIVLDDYGWSTNIAQKEAFDKFAEKRGVQVLSLPTGQGLIFKP